MKTTLLKPVKPFCSIGKIVFILLLTSFLSFQSSYCQNEMSEKEWFYYYMFQNNDSANSIFPYYVTTSFLDIYLEKFYSEEYLQKKNDEFLLPKLKARVTKEINDGIKNLDFNKEFAYYYSGTFGQYNFEKGYFPIAIPLLEIGRYYPDISISRSNYTRFEIKLFDDDRYFLYRANETDAESIVNKRRNIDGSINRSVYVKITYNVEALTYGLKHARNDYLKINFKDLKVSMDFSEADSTVAF